MGLKEDIIERLETAKQTIISNIDTEKIRASGKTQNSLKVEDRGESIVLISDGSGAPFETLQFGRPSGKIPYGFNLTIQQWIKDKGISVIPIEYKRQPSAKWQPKYSPIERGLMALAGSISNSIKKSGTRRLKQPNLNVYSKVIDDVFEDLKNIVSLSMISEIKR